MGLFIVVWVYVALKVLLKHINAKEGVHFFWDNSGNEILDQLLLCMGKYGVVVGCGIGSEIDYKLKNWDKIIERSLRIEGFKVTDFEEQFEEAEFFLKNMIKTNSIKFTEHIEEGIEKCPKALGKLFMRKTIGKNLVKIST